MISAKEAIIQSLKNKEELNKKRIEDKIKESEALLRNSIKDGLTLFCMFFEPKDYDLGNIVKTHYEHNGYKTSTSFYEKNENRMWWQLEEEDRKKILIYIHTISWEINDNT